MEAMTTAGEERFGCLLAAIKVIALAGLAGIVVLVIGFIVIDWDSDEELFSGTGVTTELEDALDAHGLDLSSDSEVQYDIYEYWNGYGLGLRIATDQVGLDELLASLGRSRADLVSHFDPWETEFSSDPELYRWDNEQLGSADGLVIRNPSGPGDWLGIAVVEMSGTQIIFVGSEIY